MQNCPAPYLFLNYNNGAGYLGIDTVFIKPDGSFTYHSRHIAVPQVISMGNGQTQINNLYVAPGYALNISGDASSYRALFTSKLISGKGSGANRYQRLLDSLAMVTNLSSSPYQLPSAQSMALVKSQQKTNDSLANAVFTNPLNTDEHSSYFLDLILKENKLKTLFMVLTYPRFNGYDAKASKLFVHKYADNQVLTGLFKPGYARAVERSRSGAASAYIDYLLQQDYYRDSTLPTGLEAFFAKASQVFVAGAKQAILFSSLRNKLYSNLSLQQFRDLENLYARFIPVFKGSRYASKLEKAFTDARVEILAKQTGMPAPSFALSSYAGPIHTLAQYKGKVVYLDFWASWCKPCREETPFLKQIYEEYRNNDSLVIISIAVNDDNAAWKKAIQTDGASWLQLIDGNGQTQSNYSAYSIPKFVLIDKSGKIVTADAPRPSKAAALRHLFNSELAKPSAP